MDFQHRYILYLILNPCCLRENTDAGLERQLSGWVLAAPNRGRKSGPQLPGHATQNYLYLQPQGIWWPLMASGPQTHTAYHHRHIQDNFKTVTRRALRGLNSSYFPNNLFFFLEEIYFYLRKGHFLKYLRKYLIYTWYIWIQLNMIMSIPQWH